MPDAEAREAMIKIQLHNMKESLSTGNYKQLMYLTERASVSDIKEFLQGALMGPVHNCRGLRQWYVLEPWCEFLPAKVYVVPEDIIKDPNVCICMDHFLWAHKKWKTTVNEE